MRRGLMEPVRREERELRRRELDLRERELKLREEVNREEERRRVERRRGDEKRLEEIKRREEEIWKEETKLKRLATGKREEGRGAHRADSRGYKFVDRRSPYDRRSREARRRPRGDRRRGEVTEEGLEGMAKETSDTRSVSPGRATPESESRGSSKVERSGPKLGATYKCSDRRSPLRSPRRDRRRSTAAPTPATARRRPRGERRRETVIEEEGEKGEGDRGDEQRDDEGDSGVVEGGEERREEDLEEVGDEAVEDAEEEGENELEEERRKKVEEERGNKVEELGVEGYEPMNVGQVKCTIKNEALGNNTRKDKDALTTNESDSAKSFDYLEKRLEKVKEEMDLDDQGKLVEEGRNEY